MADEGGEEEKGIITKWKEEGSGVRNIWEAQRVCSRNGGLGIGLKRDQTQGCAGLSKNAMPNRRTNSKKEFVVILFLSASSPVFT